MFRTLAALLAIDAAVTHALVCNQTIFEECQNAFTTYIGVDNALNWDNPDGLMIAIQNQYINGVGDKNGLVTVCNGYNKLIKCLNMAGLIPSNCINGLWLLQHVKNPYNAYGYAMLMKQVEWQCGPGFYPAIDNWECIQRVYQHHNATLAKCVLSFRSHTKQDECEGVGDGMKCYRTPFRDTCHDAPIEYFGCESFREYANVEYSQCNKQCTVRL